MKYTPIFAFCNKGININYARWHSARNAEDDDNYWQYENVWFIRVAFRPLLWDRINRTSDTQRYDSVVCLGIELGKGYFYQAERIR